MINLWHGDCLELMRNIPDKSIDMVLTDPPYGTTECKWDVVIPFEPMWNELKRITKDNGAICLFGSEPFSSHLRMSSLKMFKYDWIWDKVNPSGFQVAKYVPMKRHELICVFSQGKVNYFPIKEKRDKIKTSRHYGKSSESSPLKYISSENKSYHDKNPTSILKFSNADRSNRHHPTQKPVALLEYLINTYTLENETVLDFAAGSFSTGVACVNTSRSFIGIEKDNNYFAIGKKRVQEAIRCQHLKIDQMSDTEDCLLVVMKEKTISILR